MPNFVPGAVDRGEFRLAVCGLWGYPARLGSGELASGTNDFIAFPPTSALQPLPTLQVSFLDAALSPKGVGALICRFDWVGSKRGKHPRMDGMYMPRQAFVADRYIIANVARKRRRHPCTAAMHREPQVFKPGPDDAPTTKAPGLPPKPRR